MIKMQVFGLFVVLLLWSFSVAQEFPIGAFINRPDTAEYRRCHFNWAVMMSDDRQTNDVYYRNKSNLNMVAMRWPKIYYPSVAQKWVIEAEQWPVSDLSRNFFAVHETGQMEKNAWRAIPATHPAGFLVREAVPYWEYKIGSAYIDSFLIRINYLPGRNQPVVTLSVVKKNTESPLAERTLYSDTEFGDSHYHGFALSFDLSASISASQGKAKSLAGIPSPDEQYVDVRVYWHGKVETWLDKIIIYDQKGLSLFNHEYDDQILSDAKMFQDNASYPLIKRFMLKDEPEVSGFFPYQYVDRLLASVRPNGDSSAGGRAAWTANHFLYQRFLQEAQPQELAVNIYPIEPHIPSPVLSDAEAMALGIEPLNNDYGKYNERLQKALDDLVCVDQSLYGYTWRKGLRPASEAIKAGGADRHLWFIPQVHGVLWYATGKYGPIPGYSGLRPPTPNEIRAMVFMALAYGAKGIVYYTYSTTIDARPEVGNYNPGLVHLADAGFEADHSSNYGTFAVLERGRKVFRSIFTGYRMKWEAVQAINAQLRQLGPILADSNIVWQNAATIHKGQMANVSAVIESVHTVDAKNRQDDFPAATYVEVGHLRDGNHDDYLVLVNRRCAPLQGNIDDRRKMKIRLNKSSGEWVVTQMPSGPNWIVAHDGSFTTGLFEPGEGGVYRVAPRQLGVPSQFASIAAAADAALAGQIVNVAAGNYQETRDVVIKRGVVLRLAAGVRITFAPGCGLTGEGKLETTAAE